MKFSFFFEQPVCNWSITNVLEWMAASNLYCYLHTFSVNNIDGKSLTNLDDDQLKVCCTT